MRPFTFELVSLGIAIIVTCLALAVSHWLPLLGKLSRVSAYVWGTVLLWAGFTGWRLANGDWRTAAGLALICLCGGMTVIGAYRWDAFIDKHKSNARKAKMAEAVDDDLAE